MAYGHRLNIEDIYWKLAEDHFAAASDLSGRVKHTGDTGSEDLSFEGYPTDPGLACVAVAVVGWAVAVEGFVNLAWNRTIAPQLPGTEIPDRLLKQFSTPEKLREILRHFECDLATLEWWPGVKRLFELRNMLVHYKQPVAYQGRGYAPAIAQTLTVEAVTKARESAVSAIRLTGELCKLRTSFLDGDYEIAEISG